jgi:hypothetical protein
LANVAPDGGDCDHANLTLGTDTKHLFLHCPQCAATGHIKLQRRPVPQLFVTSEARALLATWWSSNKSLCKHPYFVTENQKPKCVKCHMNASASQRTLAAVLRGLCSR